MHFDFGSAFLAIALLVVIVLAVFKFLRRYFKPRNAGFVLVAMFALIVGIGAVVHSERERLAFLRDQNMQNSVVRPPTFDPDIELLTQTETFEWRVSCVGDVCTPVQEPVVYQLPNCAELGMLGDCVDKEAILATLKTASYRFNRVGPIKLGEPQTIAVVLNTSDSTDFDKELNNLPGARSTGTTSISMQMEAELVGSAFSIEPQGRQRREISTLNPTRWEWELTPERGGLQHLEVAVYVILTRNGEKIGEDKPVSAVQGVEVTVSPLDAIIAFTKRTDPLRASIFAFVAGLAGIMAWFGIKGSKDFFRTEPTEEKTQTIELIIKDGAGTTQKNEASK